MSKPKITAQEAIQLLQSGCPKCGHKVHVSSHSCFYLDRKPDVSWMFLDIDCPAQVHGFRDWTYHYDLGRCEDQEALIVLEYLKEEILDKKKAKTK